MSKAIRIAAAAFCLVAALSLPVLARATQSEQRPLRIADLFELESVGRYYGGPYSFAPDGQSLAFTRVRASKTLRDHKLEFLWGNAGADVWLQAAPGQAPVNLTHGERDGAGWWGPQWSPDGQWLTVLSTKTGDNVTLWTWERATGQLRQLTTRGVDLSEVHVRPVLWVDERHVLCPVLPVGEQPQGMRLEIQTPAIASAAWPKVRKGTEVTASVLNSGVVPDLSQRPQGELLLIDVTDGSSRVVAAGSTQGWRLSPTGKHVAFLRQVGVYTPKADQALPFGASGTFTVEVRRIDGAAVKAVGALPTDVLEDSLRWSSDATELAFLSFAGSHDAAPELYRLTVDTGRLSKLPLRKLDAAPAVRLSPQLEWTSAGDLIVLAAQRQGDVRPAVDSRRDWWMIPRAGGAPRNLSGQMKQVPKRLWPQQGRSAFFGLAAGEIWRVLPAKASVQNLTAQVETPVTEIAWPIVTNNGIEQWPQPDATYTQAAFSVRGAATSEYFRLDLASGRIVSLRKPAANAALVAFEPRSGVAVYSAADRDGAFIWRQAPSGTGPSSDGVDELMAANTFLRNVVEGEFKSIEYVSLNGEPLKAWLILPVGYQPGKRYPLLTWVYAGSVAGPVPPSYQSIGQLSSLSMQIPAANGYVVLMPSMPLKREGLTDDPMLELPNGVLPAVDKVVELGFADPQRLFLMGQSFGGFSTYGLVTQTQRFKAAVSLAGLSNLISLYGQFDARLRYTEYPQEMLFQAALMESAQVRMGGPPWKDLGRYIRNSPVFFVDRVQTPLMIIQGDMDYVALQQGEEFFMSLYRQGKRAQFVRYWGEGHVLSSPANIKDMWRRVFAWFDEFSPHTAGNVSQAGSG